jgi:hypothetical protein
MGAISSPTVVQLLPNAGLKIIQVKGSTDTGETFDASSYFSTIYGLYLCEDLGVVKPATWVAATRVITIGSVSAGVHSMLVWGV